MQAIVAQLTAGATIALTPMYAKVVLRLGFLDWTAALRVPRDRARDRQPARRVRHRLLGAKVAKGRMVIGGYVVYGLAVVGLGLTTKPAARAGSRVRDGRLEHGLHHPDARRSSRNGRQAT